MSPTALTKILKVALTQPAVMAILHEEGLTASPTSVNVNEYLAIAKAFCSGAMVVCPYIEAM
jgi:hypothetical protein